MLRSVSLIFFLAGSLAAQTLEINQDVVTRADSLKATLRLGTLLAGKAVLKLKWTDSYGRTVAIEERDAVIDRGVLRFALPLDRAVAIHNSLAVELAVDGRVIKVPPADFVVTPPPVWDDYQVIMYYPYKSAQQPMLRDLGVTAGQIQNVPSRTPDGAAIWWKNGYRFYCDQMAYDFFAPYHTPALKDKEQRMKEAKALYKSDRSRKDAFYRQPCFHDPVAEDKAMTRIREVVRAQYRFRPFFYSTDETGVANLVEAWDFCFCPRTMSAMRSWLLDQYGSLSAINREWGTSFSTLEEVTPYTTDEMMKRGDDNLSPWADHRTFMNLTFASAARKASDTVRSVDPSAIAGLVGCQMPSAFGGYDYWLLSQAIDVAEPYNIGNNREIWRSFAPSKPALTTGFGASDQEIWRLWYQALHGDMGVIIYDEESRYLDATGKPTALGSLIAPTYRELTGGIGKQLHTMERVNDPIAIHYSQPSITAHWMFERRPLGEAWVEKRSWHERRESDFLRLRQSVIYLLEDNLQQYYFVSYAQLENGAFDRMGTKVMFLPQSVAMSPAECDALRRFVGRGGVLIADCRTALMDSHCRIGDKGQLDDLFGIERKDLRYAPGPPGLRLRKRGTAGSLPPTLNGISIAEPGIRALSDSEALYEDMNGAPAVIVRKHTGGKTVYLNALVTDYHRWRLRPPEGKSLREFIAKLLGDAGVVRQYEISCSDGNPPPGIEIHPWRAGALRILGIQRNYGLNVSELGPPEYQKQEALEMPLEIRIHLGGPVALYDTRRGEFLGMRRDYVLPIDRIQPAILAILPEPARGLVITAPGQAHPGDLIQVRLRLDAPTPGNYHTFRVQVIDPRGRELSMLATNVAASRGDVLWNLPLAADSAKGKYTLKARDIATGIKAERGLLVQ